MGFKAAAWAISMSDFKRMTFLPGYSGQRLPVVQAGWRFTSVKTFWLKGRLCRDCAATA
jgi:hypothetical protein